MWVVNAQATYGSLFSALQIEGKPILHVTWYITMLCCACKQSPAPTASTCMCVLVQWHQAKVARPSAICTHALLCQCYRLMMMTRARDCPTERGLPNRLMRFIHGTTRSEQAGSREKQISPQLQDHDHRLVFSWDLNHAAYFLKVWIWSTVNRVVGSWLPFYFILLVWASFSSCSSTATTWSVQLCL